MKNLAVRCVALLAFIAVARAAPLTRDLGQGLVYHRVHQLPADLPTAAAGHGQPCVLDLRYVPGDAAAAAALGAWLKFNATERAPVFVLANVDTGAAVRSAIARRHVGASLVVLGAAAPGFTPDIALKVSAEAERRAYDALEQGAAADSLIAENPDKPRNDEAKLAKERQSESGAPSDDAPAASSPSAGETVAKPKPPAPPVDAALQRAVQLHRALLALKKL